MSHLRVRWASLLLASSLLLTPGPLAAQRDGAALLRMAQKQEADGEIDEATENYEQVVEQFPDSPQAPPALLALARIRDREGDEVATGNLLETLSKSYPQSNAAATGLVLEASIRVRNATGTDDLRDADRKLVTLPALFQASDHPVLPARVESFVRRGRIRLALGEPTVAAYEFLRVIEDEPYSEWIVDAELGLARSFAAGGDWAAAAEILQRVSESGREDAAQEALRELAFLHRHWIRPDADQLPWARGLVLGGIAWKKPLRVAAADDGRIAVFDPGAGVTAVIGVDGTVTDRRQSKDARDVMWGRDGTGYQVGPEGSTTLGQSPRSRTFNPKGNDREHVAKNIVGAQKGPFGHFLMVDREKKALMIFDEDARYLRQVGSGTGDPSDAALTGTGEVVVLDRKQARITRFDLDFETKGDPIGVSVKRPERIAADRAGNLYVLDRAENKIHLLDAEGRARRPALGPSLPGGLTIEKAEDLALDGEGRLYIVDSKNARVLVLE